TAGFHQNQLESICVFYLLASFCPASISNFKHSTGLFELALPDFAKATCFALLSPTLHSPLTVQAIWGIRIVQWTIRT
ncbi:hypothetical protein QE539_10575, partial [Streptococcus suis]|uniref:hypothetical protein n=1 Tax=Streptococcus suis TaxID=1307 RepID=UPI0037581140